MKTKKYFKGFGFSLFGINKEIIENTKYEKIYQF